MFPHICLCCFRFIGTNSVCCRSMILYRSAKHVRITDSCKKLNAISYDGENLRQYIIMCTRCDEMMKCEIFFAVVFPSENLFLDRFTVVPQLVFLFFLYAFGGKRGDPWFKLDTNFK